MVTRYSRTREVGAVHTACTKLRLEDKEALHCLAVERGLSDYELTRRILTAFIQDRSAERDPLPLNSALPAVQDPGSIR